MPLESLIEFIDLAAYIVGKQQLLRYFFHETY